MNTGADLAEKNICELKRQNWFSSSGSLDIPGRGMNSPDEKKLNFTKNWQIENEHFVTRALEVIQKLEEWKRDQEFQFEDFSRRRMVENHFKDVETVCSGQLLHVPSQQALFPLPREPGGLLSRDSNLHTHGFSGNVFWMVYMRVLRQFIQECSTQGISLLREIFRCKQARRNP